jgi:hypothetical protein
LLAVLIKAQKKASRIDQGPEKSIKKLIAGRDTTVNIIHDDPHRIICYHYIYCGNPKHIHTF